jgi:hypothetical protein
MYEGEREVDSLYPVSIHGRLIAVPKSKRFGEPLLQPRSVRYMSVTSVVQRRLLTGDDRG